jgi:predicted MFS family arabinose efflux permease
MESIINPKYVTVKLVMAVTRNSSSFASVGLALGGCASVAVAFGFARYGFGLFVPVFHEEFGLNSLSIGAIASGTYVVYLASLIGAGVATALWGPRLPVLVGNLSAFIGLTVVAFASSAGQLVVGLLIAAGSSGWVWAPFADAVVLGVPFALRDRVLAVIASGTAFGLVMAGPLALLGDRPGAWRLVWAAFALGAGAVAVLSMAVVPRRALESPPNRSSRRLQMSRKALPLLAHAALYGGIAAGYYTFAVELLHDEGLGPAWSSLLWLMVGIGGISGLGVGDLARTAGLRRALALFVTLLSLSIAALGALPISPLSAAIAGLSYGLAYMPIGVLLALWNQDLNRENPATGFTFVLCSLGLGSVVGSLAFGALAQFCQLRDVFLLLGALMLLCLAFLPTRR